MNQYGEYTTECSNLVTFAFGEMELNFFMERLTQLMALESPPLITVSNKLQSKRWEDILDHLD